MLYDKRWDVKHGDTALLAAADYLQKHGWCQRSFIKEDGRACALGALNAVAPYEDYCRAYKRLEKYLGTASIAGWNDERGRTQEQVVAALVGAAY